MVGGRWSVVGGASLFSASGVSITALNDAESLLPGESIWLNEVIQVSKLQTEESTTPTGVRASPLNQKLKQ